jgi:hypothetical protein
VVHLHWRKRFVGDLRIAQPKTPYYIGNIIGVVVNSMMVLGILGHAGLTY